MHNTYEFWLILYLICLIYTIIVLFEKIYKADQKERDKQGPEGMRKLIANLEVPHSSGLVHDIFNDDGGLLKSPDGHLKIPHPWPGQNPPP